MASKLGRSIIKPQRPIRPKGQVKCDVHKQNEVVFLCQDCKMLICTKCSITLHKEHINSFLEISDIKTRHNQILQDFVNETENVNIPKLNQEIISSRTKMTSCKPMYDKLRKNIIDNNEKCKLELDKITEDYITLCDKMEVAAMDLIQTHITDLESRLKTLRELSSEYKQTLQTGTGVLVYDSASEIQEIDLGISPTPNIDMAQFTPGMDRLSHLKQALGNLKLTTDHLQAGSPTSGHSEQRPVVRPKQSTEAGQASTGEVRYKLRDRPTVMSQFPSPGYITSICPTSDGRAWLCNYVTNTVNLINNQVQVIQTVRHSSDIWDISVDPTTGRLWFCCWGDKTICEVSTSHKPVTRFTTDDDPDSLCVTREGRVVVGTRGRQVYKVWVYTVDGQVLHTDIVEGGVQSISQCGVTGNIAVVVYRKRIIVYNSTLQPLVNYQGEGIQARGEGIQIWGSVTPEQFDPRTVVYDSKGNIVIADQTRNTIELISGAGKYIKTLHTNKERQGPVGIQKGDVLWSNLELDTGEWVLKLLKYYSD
ncbi:uncharacterized protein LOC117341873 [Pecten maximus]|uniref:uncharacterized protein LOC117341873 n=1 Tax=Pecten maximus TaxID=6579 RepID=UPI0014583887|nr:uncharacterized protein LOC117341873 [Pecten maximus]